MNNDPILEAIKEHRLLFQAWCRALKRVGAPDIENKDVHWDYLAASKRLFQTIPETRDGVLALLDYVLDEEPVMGTEWGAINGTSPEWDILRSIRRGLAFVTPPRVAA